MEGGGVPGGEDGAPSGMRGGTHAYVRRGGSGPRASNMNVGTGKAKNTRDKLCASALCPTASTGMRRRCHQNAIPPILMEPIIVR